MILYITKWFSAWLLPPGGLILALLAVTLYLWHCRSRGRYFLALVTLAFYLLSLAPLANALVHPLENACKQPALEQLDGDVIILLGGGSYAGVPDVDGTDQISSLAASRVLTALRLQRATHLPLLLTGGTVMPGDANEAAIEKRIFLAAGVPEDKIFLENKSRNTAENAAFSKKIARQEGWQKPILVTSAFHQKRAGLFFTRAGFHFTPYPCDYLTNKTTHWSAYSLVPQADSLYNSCLALKEYLGLSAIYLGLQ